MLNYNIYYVLSEGFEMPKIDKIPDEVPHYRKKSKGTNTRKSKHKHIYADGILLLREQKRYRPTGELITIAERKVLCEYCTICGKINRTYDWLGIMQGSRAEELRHKLSDTSLKVFAVDADYAYKMKLVDVSTYIENVVK
jgi:hypothetical protein